MKVYVSARGGDPRQLHVLKQKTSQRLLLKYYWSAKKFKTLSRIQNCTNPIKWPLKWVPAMLCSFVLLYKMQRFFYNGHSLKRADCSYLKKKSSVKAQGETTVVETCVKMCHDTNVTLKNNFWHKHQTAHEGSRV